MDYFLLQGGMQHAARMKETDAAVFLRLLGDAIGSTVALQNEGSGFKSRSYGFSSVQKRHC